MSEIYSQICLPAPREIIEFSSVEKAFGEFHAWSRRAEGVLTCFWSYQFLMAIPSSYRNNFYLKKDGYRFDVVRASNSYGCFVYGKYIESELIHPFNEVAYLKICDELKQVRFNSTTESLVSEILENHEIEIDFFDATMASEDPTCQMGIDDFIFLGDFEWVQQELWLLNKFKEDCSIAINQRMFDTLSNIVNCNKLLFTFKNMVIAVGEI
ncbi:hypothetical protein IB234_23495 [Pseudomonas sp. PDM16]|uniref:hypothetical protein n=1 Tax=Pseudomonas sp. PDM16 TaxID=2769292 RepID=UPI00177E22AE|nr:hypothetical protein [Pseudomonas sp. PDM16]MBD9417541.1 hypothetical protein [Pseudomonas sp. PDM16]